MADKLKTELEKALQALKKEKARKFNQTVELVVNLQKFDYKKTPVSLFFTLPHKVKEKKIAGFLEAKNKKIDTILLSDFKRYKDKKEIKKLVKKYDFFISQSSLMPKVATSFGKVLGPSGKMPSPQIGIIVNADDKTIEELKNKINKSIKIRVKESSIKIPIGKQDMKDEELIENAISVYNSIIKALPRNQDNIKNILIKFTMTKPIKIDVK